MDKKNLIERIDELKKEKKAIILAHNYQLPEVQDIADFLGDSLELSRKAAQTDAEVVVFCGVHFMAETAKILSPEKKILLPDKEAGCNMVNMFSSSEWEKLKKRYPKAARVAYVNSSAKIKSEVDICCTSANAVKVINSLKKDEIIFIPDKYLASYVSRKTKKKIHFTNSYCPTHLKILPEDIKRKKELYPEAKVVVHPECTPQVIDLADKVESTSGMCRYAQESKAREFIIGTERELLYRLRKENPEKKFYPASELAICPNMKRINLEKVLWSLQDMRYEIKVPEEIRVKAKRAVDRMMEVS